MRPGWVAGSVRARLLLGRRLGREAALALATSPSLDDALARLAATPYGRELVPGSGLEEAQRAVLTTTLWHLRVLAGWLPPRGADVIRSLAAWYELANIEDRLAYLSGGLARRPFELGALAAAWPQALAARTPTDLRAALASSPWGDPGGETPEAIHLGLRLAWARRVLVDVPEATAWVAGAAALALARELFVAKRRVDGLGAHRLPGLAPGWEGASGIPELVQRLPARAAWALSGIEAPEDIWRAESAWWTTVEDDANQLARDSRSGRAVIVGVIAALAVDARRVAAALGVAARGGDPQLVEELGAIT